MPQDMLVERLFETLVNGDRPGARTIVQDGLARGTPAAVMLTDLFWPVHEYIEKLNRADQMTGVSYHLSTRLLRMLVDQAAARLEIATPRGESVFCACGPSQGEELAAQMACDLLESSGFEVAFSGGGVPADEILAQVQERQPTYLVLFASAASDLPDIRHVIDTMREIGACAGTKVIVGGGVFNRAEGLAQEIGAHDWAYSPADLVDLLTLEPEVEATPVRQTAPPKPAAIRKRAAA
ncbi:MAG: hypothetical protein HBSAPP03_28740 [Phycisphaerae bacterium]|nr:MAG: hypothetical protein HBSAPP03_28740 [Phycisphaerae bacterium]